MNDWNFRCFHCLQKLALAEHGFCSLCIKQLQKTPYCGRCGATLLEAQRHCGNCLRDEPKWQRLVQISHYKPPLVEWVHRFKFQQHYYLDEALARLLYLAVRQARREHHLTLPEVILPVPLFWQRHWQRGYNQAELLARPLAKWLNIPLDTDSLVRVRKTTPQRNLSSSQRQKNLKGAFFYQPRLPYQHVAILDDVITTGSTLNAIALELLKQNVSEIQVWALAKT